MYDRILNNIINLIIFGEQFIVGDFYHFANNRIMRKWSSEPKMYNLDIVYI